MLKLLNWVRKIFYKIEKVFVKVDRKLSWMIRKEEMRIYLKEQKELRDRASKNMIVVTKGEIL